jgi:hypothetical protein
MKQPVHVECLEEMKNAYKILVENLKRKGH